MYEVIPYPWYIDVPVNLQYFWFGDKNQNLYMYRRPPLLSVREEENYDYLDEDHLDERQQVFSCLEDV